MYFMDFHISPWIAKLSYIFIGFRAVNLDLLPPFAVFRLASGLLRTSNDFNDFFFVFHDFHRFTWSLYGFGVSSWI